MVLDFLDDYFIGNISFRWILLAFVIIVALIGLIVIIATPQPEPVIEEMMCDGFYHARYKNFLANAPLNKAVCVRPTKCWNQSWIQFQGNCTVGVGEFAQTRYVDNKRLYGVIDIISRDPRILESDDVNWKTPGKFHIIGEIQEPFAIDFEGLLPWGLTILSTSGFLWAVFYRKIKRMRFNAKSAERIFRGYCKDKVWDIVDEILVSPPELIGGVKCWNVGAYIEKTRDMAAEFYGLRVDARGEIHSKLKDVDGKLIDAWFKREGLDYFRKREAVRDKYPAETVAGAYQKGKREGEAEKLARIRRRPERLPPPRPTPDEAERRASELAEHTTKETEEGEKRG